MGHTVSMRDGRTNETDKQDEGSDQDIALRSHDADKAPQLEIES